MTRRSPMYSRIFKLSAIFAIVCVCAFPAFGQVAQVNKPAPIRQLQQTLEQSPQSNESEPQKMVKVFKLKPITHENRSMIVDAIVESLKIPCNATSDSVIVIGTEKQLQDAEKIIHDFNDLFISNRKNLVTAIVRVIWLAEGDETASAPEENLKGVIEELHRLGLKNVGQVGQVVVRSLTDGNFRISCTPLLENKPTTLTAEGRIYQEKGLHISISATGYQQALAMENVRGPDRPNHEGLVGLDVDTIYTPGNYNVLSVAPIGKITSVFVNQITEDKQQRQ